MRLRLAWLLAAVSLSALLPVEAQTPFTLPASSAATAVPPLIRYSGIAKDADGKPLTGEGNISFLIYTQEEGGSPLWVESQTVALDNAGRYQVQLGAASLNGIPLELFATGEARWLEIQIAGQKVQPRALLASVAYAMKAGDATTLGGLPASAFALAGTKSAAFATALTSQTATPDANSTVTTPGGTTGYLPVFTGADTLGDSILFSSSTGIGVGDVPNSTAVFDVNGKSIWRGLLNVSRAGNATTTTGFDSYPIFLQGSVYNSATKAAVLPAFQLQVEPTGNDTATPGATFNLLASSTGGTPGETGLYFNTNGTLNFAPGQTFPGTITGVTAGADLTGSATAGVVTLNLNTAATNALYSQLATNNTFAGIQSFSKVGIGTTTPRSLLEIQASASKALGPVLTLTNTLGGLGAESTLDFNTYMPSTVGTYNPMARIAAQDADHSSDNLLFQSNLPGTANSGLQTNMIIQSNGQTGINTTAPGSQLEVDANATLGTDAIYGFGATTTAGGGTIGVEGFGGSSTIANTAGSGGIFTGGYAEGTGNGGDGIDASAGNSASPTSPAGYAGNFSGDVYVSGVLTSTSPDVEIDHPLDPANKYLDHASIGSSEMLNIYSGNVITDELGLATVKLPDWFEAENGDFRYQLTTIGRDAHAWIAQKIANHQFKIATNATNVEVSWQVTGVRQDAYAQAHPLVVERSKSARERGFYAHPELYGQPAEKQTQWARHPEMMRRMNALQERQKTALTKSTAP